MKFQTILSWTLRIIAAVILFQTLYFKFTAAPESVYIFSTIGLEPWGRIGVGVSELVVGILLLMPRTAWLGAVGGIGVISGAIFFHLTILGIEVQGDGGFLFYLAIIVFISCLIIAFIHRNEIFSQLQKWNILKK